jgi:Neurotransmitter-gated ion-channel ligand binding domain/Neurotransmitter-gated ion-channel transmembrane region
MISDFSWVLALLAMFASASSAASEPRQAPNSPVAGGETIVDPFAWPGSDRPVTIRAGFELIDINEIDDGAETFEFTGVLTLEWRDPSRAFAAAADGAATRLFQGEYQVREVAAGWYPQFVLRNQADSFERSGVSLRVRSDGSCVLTETIHAVADSEMDMRRYPFDAHRIEAVFGMVGALSGEISIENSAPRLGIDSVEIPQWVVHDHGAEVRSRARAPTKGGGEVSQFVVFADIRREPLFALRLLVVPLVLIVLLSFCIFWMDRNSIGDRLNVSFIGVLTAVSFLIVTSDQLPRISYVTLIHQFLSLSFFVMCATALVNLMVGALERRGQHDLSGRVDRACRWIFPFGYLAVLASIVIYAFTGS